MKTQLYILFIFYAFLPGIYVQTKKTCLISRMTSDNGDTLHFLYDNRGMVNRITGSSGYITNFKYYGNTIVATETVNNEMTYKRVMTLGYNGMMSSLFEEHYGNGTASWVYRSYTFDGEKLTGVASILSSGAPPIQSSLIWLKGNFISESSNDVKQEMNNGNTYEYFTDKSAQPGGYWYINLLPTMGTGDGLYRNKNLLKTIRSKNSVTHISYEFDKEEKIISMQTINKGIPKIWHYEYTCM